MFLAATLVGRIATFTKCLFTTKAPKMKELLDLLLLVKSLPILVTERWAAADPGVQAVSPQVTISHTAGGRLTLLSARLAVTFPDAEHHRPLAGTKLYCLVTEAHRCEQLAQGCYAAFAPSRN